MTNVVGVGCTSTLVSVPKKRPGQTTVEVRKSLAHLCLSFPDGLIRSYTLVMGIGSNDDTTTASSTATTTITTTTSSKSKGRDNNDDKGVVNEGLGEVRRRRTRAEEEELLGNFILWTLVREQERRHSVVTNQFKSNGNTEADDEGVVDQSDAFDLGILDSEQGDTVVMKEFSCTHPLSLPKGSSINKDNDIDQDMQLIVQEKAQHIIDGDVAAKNNKNKTKAVQIDPVVLVPSIRMRSSNGDGEINDNGKTQMVPLIHTVLPPNPIIFPGSFNPPHVGHVALARAAVKAMTQKHALELEEWFQEDEEGDGDVDSDGEELLETIWNTMEHQGVVKRNQQQSDNSPFYILFEMSLTNADKPPMEASEAARRVALFAKYHDSIEDNLHSDSDSTNRDGKEDVISSTIDSSCNNTMHTTPMPSEWGVVLTNAPLFLDKVRTLKKYLVQESPLPPTELDSSYCLSTSSSDNKKLRMGRGRILTFAIGTDTMVRIINPKYYNQDRGQMLEAVREMGREGVHFVVGGRLEQVRPQEGEADKQRQTRFVTGEDELIDLPPDVREMFTIVQEEDFRLDISSSELRARMQDV